MYKRILFIICVIILVIGGVVYVKSRGSFPAPVSEEPTWKESLSGGVKFKYPEKLDTTYISTQDWPPQAQVLSERFTCTEAGWASDRAGKTSKQTVNGRTYCVTEINDGAAGSVYTQYAYLFPKEGKTIGLTFTLRSVQCGNYEEPEKKSCETERAGFDMSGIIDRIAQTLEFVNQK